MQWVMEYEIWDDGLIYQGLSHQFTNIITADICGCSQTTGNTMKVT